MLGMLFQSDIVRSSWIRMYSLSAELRAIREPHGKVRRVSSLILWDVKLLVEAVQCALVL